MKVFVAGGTGFVGGHLVRELRRNGHTVVLLTHNVARGPEPGIEIARGDVADPVSVGAAVWGCDAVINLVGIIREFPSKGVTFDRLHVLATRNVVDAAREGGIRRYLQMSALGTRPEAVSAYHRTKYAAEEYVRASGLDWTIFRPSLIYGPKDAFVNMLADQIRKFPVIPVIGDGSYRMQPIHADDVARCFVRSLAMPETVGQTYELCGPDRFTFREMLNVVARTLGKSSVTTVSSPVGLMKSVVPFLQKIPAFPLTSDQLQMLLEESICNEGWRKTFPCDPVRFKEGIKEYLKRLP